MKATKLALAQLRRLYYNLTGELAVFDDYCFFEMWYDGCNFFEIFWHLKKSIDKMLAKGMRPKFKLVSLDRNKEIPFETVNGYYQF